MLINLGLVTPSRGMCAPLNPKPEMHSRLKNKLCVFLIFFLPLLRLCFTISHFFQSWLCIWNSISHIQKCMVQSPVSPRPHARLPRQSLYPPLECIRISKEAKSASFLSYSPTIILQVTFEGMIGMQVSGSDLANDWQKFCSVLTSLALTWIIHRT